MSDFLYDYLRQTFGLEEMAVEWAYSLRHSVERFSTSDEKIKLFWNVLSGTVGILSSVWLAISGTFFQARLVAVDCN